MVNIEITENLAYALGASTKVKRPFLRLGPFSSVEAPPTRLYSNHITSGNDFLVSAIRHQPKIIHILTDLLSHTEVTSPHKIWNLVWLKPQHTSVYFNPLLFPLPPPPPQVRDLWLKGTDYESFHVLHSETLTTEMMENAFIAKSDSSHTYSKMLRSSNLIHVIRIVLIDSNCRLVNFAKGTQLSLGLKMMPLAENQ